jgi:hypothetical protein
LTASVVIVGCRHSADPAPSNGGSATAMSGPAATTTDAALKPCATPNGSGKTEDLDGDGTPDLLVLGYREVEVYLHRGDCLKHVTTIDADGRVAFVTVLPTAHAGMRDLSIDTWLYHGDRKRNDWLWTGHGYLSSGRGETIPGPPHLPPRRR